MRSLMREFYRDGYLVIPEFIGQEKAQEISEHIDQYIEAHVAKDPSLALYDDVNDPTSIKQIITPETLDPYFKELLHSPVFVDVATQIFGNKVQIIGSMIFQKLDSASPATPPHQDGYFHKISPNEAAIFWLALTPINQDNGCLSYIPGSHTSGLRVHQKSGVHGFSECIKDYADSDRKREVPVPAQPGTLLAHHSLTIHAQGPNISGDVHRAIGFIYYSEEAEIDKAERKKYEAALEKAGARGTGAATS